MFRDDPCLVFKTLNEEKIDEDWVEDLSFCNNILSYKPLKKTQL